MLLAIITASLLRYDFPLFQRIVHVLYLHVNITKLILISNNRYTSEHSYQLFLKTYILKQHTHTGIDHSVVIALADPACNRYSGVVTSIYNKSNNKFSLWYIIPTKLNITMSQQLGVC